MLRICSAAPSLIRPAGAASPSWATVWRRNFTPEELDKRLQTDEHALAEHRAIGAPSNMPAFATAFGCKAGDPMVRSGDKQVVAW